MVPIDKMRIWGKYEITESPPITIKNAWVSIPDQPTQTTFRVFCDKVAQCENFKRSLLSNQLLDNLEMQYLIKGSDPAVETLTFLEEHILGGSLFTEVVKSFPPGQKRICLIGNDVETIASEAVSQAIAQMVTNETFVEPDDKMVFSDLLIDCLKGRWEHRGEIPPSMWDSVFWNQTWARPDKLTEFLNSVLTTNPNDANYFNLKWNKIDTSVNVYNHTMPQLRILAWGSGLDRVTELGTRVPKAFLLKYLLDKGFGVEWREGSFRVASAKWYCFDPTQINATSPIVSTIVNVKQHRKIHCANLTVEAVVSTEDFSECLKMANLKFEEKLNAQKEAILHTVGHEFEEKLNNQREEKMAQIQFIKEIQIQLSIMEGKVKSFLHQVEGKKKKEEEGQRKKEKRNKKGRRTYVHKAVGKRMQR